jgi:tetratricopeptide (TPR) repeat protein
MKNLTYTAFALLFVWSLSASSGAAQSLPEGTSRSSSSQVTTYCDDSISAADCAMAQEVANRIASVITLEHDLHTWPPDLFVHDQKDENGNSVLNAFAHPCGGDIDAGMPHDCSAPEGSTKPHVHFTKAILDQVIQGNADRLALIMGHEMAHITLGHTTQYAYQMLAQSELTLKAFGRQQEIGSDITGMKYGLAAGYNKQGMTDAFYKFVELGPGYSSFEGLSVSTHPTWDERLTFIDEANIELWRNMMAFRTGVSMLAAEQYTMAATLFRNVIAQFPDSYEAHANLGYAQLMDYMDQLEPADIANFEIGHLVVGAFTRRPESMEPQVRGINAQLWFQATTSLQSALRLNPGLSEAKANLGIAYLVQPQGSNAAEARRLLAEAVASAQYNSSMDPRTKAAIFINAGVAELAEGLIQASFDHMTSASGQLDRIKYLSNMGDVIQYNGLQTALYYNTALIFSNVDDPELKASSLDYFNAYLSGTSPSSNWWQLAYNRYVAVANGLGVSPNSVEHYRQNHEPTYRTLTGYVFPNGVQVNLGQSIDEVLNNMGAAGVTTDDVEVYRLIENTDLVDYYFVNAQTSVWATQEVLSIQLYGPAAPAIGIQEAGLGSDISYVRVGMSVTELDAILGMDYERRLLVSFSDDYRFYRNLGLAAAVDNGIVTELVITQVPYEQYWEPGQ